MSLHHVCTYVKNIHNNKLFIEKFLKIKLFISLTIEKIFFIHYKFIEILMFAMCKDKVKSKLLQFN